MKIEYARRGRQHHACAAKIIAGKVERVGRRVELTRVSRVEHTLKYAACGVETKKSERAKKKPIPERTNLDRSVLPRIFSSPAPCVRRRRSFLVLFSIRKMCRIIKIGVCLRIHILVRIRVCAEARSAHNGGEFPKGKS